MSDVKNTPPLTPAQQIRLESVSLAYRHDRSPEDVIERATKLAAWVEGNKAATKKGAKAPSVANDEQVEPENDLI
jgi:hypothetical protein